MSLSLYIYIYIHIHKGLPGAPPLPRRGRRLAAQRAV